jgi:hypothetical protein
MKKYYLRLSMCAILASLLTCNSQAVTIISDTFTGGTNGDSLSAHTPDTNLPGGSWLNPSINPAVPEFTLASGTASGNPQRSSAISILSNGGYVKPTQFTISADLSPNNMSVSDPASGGRGIALGFFSATGTNSFSQNLFTGLVLDANGRLGLVQDPNSSGFFGAGSTLGTTVAYAGGVFSATSFYTLSYTVDTTTGTISGISLSGSTADYSSLAANTLFTNAATSYAGFYESATTFAQAGVDNFQVSTIPEPSTWALLALAGFVCLTFSRSRNKKVN